MFVYGGLSDTLTLPATGLTITYRRSDPLANVTVPPEFGAPDGKKVTAGIRPTLEVKVVLPKKVVPVSKLT
jgi:hypothetical protein